jgi:hypothetical protein
MLDEFDDLAFGDAADLIEIEASFALEVFGRFGGTEECVGDHRDGGDSCSAHAQRYFQIGE